MTTMPNEALKIAIRLQKCLALAAGAGTKEEADAAASSARKLINLHKINLTVIPNESLYDSANFATNELLQTLRKEYLDMRPHRKVKLNEKINNSPVIKHIDQPGTTLKTKKRRIAKKSINENFEIGQWCKERGWSTATKLEATKLFGVGETTVRRSYYYVNYLSSELQEALRSGEIAQVATDDMISQVKDRLDSHTRQLEWLANQRKINKN